MDINQLIKNCKMPAMPHVAAKIMSLVSNPYSKMSDIQDAISADQALTSRILKMSSSVFFKGRREISTITDAIMMLGLDSVKNIAIAIATKEIYKGNDPIAEKLWEHAIAASVAASIVAKKQDKFRINIESAVVGALLHDIGKVVLNMNFPDKYRLLDKKFYEGTVPATRLETEVFGFNHCDVGAELFKEWKFSAELIHIVKNHHLCVPPNTGEDVEEGLCEIVNIADCLCQILGAGLMEPMPDLCTDRDKQLKRLGLKTEDIESMLDEFEERFIEVKLSFMA
ncbi:MAG: HDOD domain-containing protein [Nitrospirae bacterium]|nr:HDOD domain-containing protein [Nitrospirota bacterium]